MTMQTSHSMDRARTQAALVRALRDELTRYASTDSRASALRAQLDEEQDRLSQLGGDDAVDAA